MADAETSPSAVEPSTRSQMPQKQSGATTTISTISLQSGETRLVIALLQSAESLQLKVLEGTPEITQLGATLPEAVLLQRQHEEVLLQLQSKQSPVEELLRQADQLISAQRPRAEVYAAMAESLGVAWKDVNSYLDLRKQILELNVAYQSRAEECIDRMLALETACRDTNVPVSIEAVKNLLARLHDLKRIMLESLMVTLQNGRALHEKISEIAAQGTLDSRPDKITTSANFTISQIEHWLEDLHDRRKVLEVKWQSRKAQLEQCLSLSLLAKDLKELDELLLLRKEALQNTSVQLGDSASSAELLLHEHRKLMNEAKEFQDRCLKITKATEKLTLGGHFAGEQATIQSYAILNSSVEYIEALEERDALLKQSVAFFRLSRTALTKLDQLEIQLTTTEHSLSNSNLVQLHFQVSKSLEEITSQPLQQGSSLLEAVGHSAPGAQGVKFTLQELENRKITLDNLCTAHKEENIRLSKAFTAFLERQNELYSWLVSIAEAFLQGHQDMGSVLAMADDFLQLHQQLLKDLQNKGIEINEVLLTLPPILEKLNDAQRVDIDEKVDTLHSHWLTLKNILESRIDLASLYVKFHSLSVELTNEYDGIEVEFRNGTDGEQDDMMSRIEQKWLQIQQVTGQLTNLGKLFIEESLKIGDPYLDVKRASLCVETLLEHFANRQLVISQSWGTWQTSITTEREFNVLWERNIRESDRIMEWISKLHSQLYPVLTGESTAAKIITKELEEKLQTILPELKRAQTEIELRVKTAETLAMKGEYHGQKEAIISKLMELHNELNNTATDYQILLQMLTSFFKKLSEVEKTVENLESQYHMTRLPNTCSEVDLLVKEHEASEQTVLELFRFTQNESEQIIKMIVQQEPEKAADHDTKRVIRLLEDKKVAWKSAWTARKLLLEEQQHLCQFDSDLQQINSNLSDLSKQLNTLEGQYGESLPSAKATSVAFVYFEKTIQLLENRIQTFVSTTEQILKSEYSSSHVESKLKELETKWSAFMNQVKRSRHLINTNIEYFTLIHEIEEWFRIGSKLLITIARKSTAVRRPQEADQLLSEVENFLKDGEILQQERINKISNLAEELHGEEGPKQVSIVRNENKEMVDSFTIIRKELQILSQNLRTAEEQREKQKKEMEEAEYVLATAKAEATAAKAAATAAEEARRAAEAAAKVLQEAMPVIEKVEAETQVILPRETAKDTEKLRKSPSPPSKRAKVSDEVHEEVQRSSAPIFTFPLQDATVQEGQRFTFECRVTGFPVPEVIWYKDGISIQDNPDYRTSYDDGICTLAIEETFSEDSARFTCKATNTVGSAETSATLSVQEAEPEEQLFPPVFTKRIEETSAKEGSTLYLMCTVEGNPLPTVQWFKNNTCIDNSSDYVITYNNGDAVIKFEEVFLEDQAEYTCKASNALGSDKCSAKLTVEPLESTEAPVFVTLLSNTMARAGRKIQLECEVKGLPMPELTWTHNAKIVKDSQDVKLLFENGKSVLTIREAFPKDAGTYRVVAKNIAGEATCSCNVSVKGRLPTETSDSEIASDFEPIKPSIQLSLKDVCVLEGEQVCLDCIIVGQPEPEVIWYHNNQPVKESSDFQLLFQGDRCSLVIHEAYLEDAGEYKVVAINSGGEASSKCDLTVKSVGEVEPKASSQVAEVAEVMLGTPPTFSKLLTDISASEGDQVVLECIVQGDPKPNIRWFLNDQEITDVILKEFKEDSEGNVGLTLLQVTFRDKGIYKIKASNSFGESECSANLIVKPVPPQETQSSVEMEEKSIPPSFKELFADRRVSENTSTKFECIVIGKPTPKVQWSINNEPVSGNDVLISVDGEHQILIIQNVLKIHSGNVACVAENDAGRATCTARLEVVDKPAQSELPNAEDTGSSYSLKQSLFRNEVFNSQSSSTTVIREEEKHVISRSEQFIQKIERKSPVQVPNQMFKEVHQVKTEYFDAENQTSSNKEDSQDSSSYATPTASPKCMRKSVAPRFISPLNGKIVDEGVEVMLDGIIDGYPPPTISWTKNGKELIPIEGKLSVNYDHNRVEVILKDVTVQDAGKYTCKVVNNVGSASSTADVVVKKTFLPPIIGRRLQAQSVKEGERVVMEVEITGIPDPIVSWYKDGQQIISTVTGSPFRTKVQGNCYSLVIDKVSLDNAGQYLVKAVNSRGEATSMAEMVVYQPKPQIETMKEVILEDIRETKIEKQVQPQIPVSEAVAESQHSPIASSLSQTVSEVQSNLSNTSFVSETRIISQTTKTEKQTSIRLEHTPSPISFKPEASHEVIKEPIVPAPEEATLKTYILSPPLPVSLTQEFKTEKQTSIRLERTPSPIYFKPEASLEVIKEQIVPAPEEAKLKTSILSPSLPISLTQEIKSEFKTEQTSIRLERTPSPISFKPEASQEVIKEPIVPAQEETKLKTSILSPSLPVSLTQEFKSEFKTEKQTSIRLERTPSPISFKPEASHEVIKEPIVPPPEEAKLKSSILSPSLPVSLTQEFKSELLIQDVERKISLPVMPTSYFNETETKVESKSITKDVSPVKVDGIQETSEFPTQTMSLVSSAIQAFNAKISESVVNQDQQPFHPVSSKPFQSVPAKTPKEMEKPYETPYEMEKRSMPFESKPDNERKEMHIELEIEHISKIDDSMNREISISEYKSIPLSMKRSEVKVECIEINDERPKPEQSIVKPEDHVISVEPVVDTEQSTEESGVETASVSKKQAYEFFINKIKEFEEENSKAVKIPIKLPVQETQTFIGSSQTGIEQHSYIKTEYYPDTPSALNLIPNAESMISQCHSEQTANIKPEDTTNQNQLTSDSFVEEICVRHEPLHETDNISKSEMIMKSKGDASTQTKDLEETRQVISPVGVSTGAVNIFPASVSEESLKQSTALHLSFTPGIIEENISQTEVALPYTVENIIFPEVGDDSFRHTSQLTDRPEPSKVAITTKQSFTHFPTLTQSTETHTQELIVSAGTVPTSTQFSGIQSEPSEFSQMEPHTAVFVSSDSSALPTQTMSLVSSAIQAFNAKISESITNQEQQPFQPVSSKSFQSVPAKTLKEGYEMEKSMPFESKSELLVHTSSSSIEHTSQIVRSVSPRPSAESLAMEKLWTPQMTRELEITIPKPPCVDQKHLDGVVSPKPSVEGLAMDKLWAHKHPDSSLKKVWPPPQHSENKPVIPWTTKDTSDKISSTIESVVDRKETKIVHHKSDTQDVSKNVQIFTPKPNIENSEGKCFVPEQQYPPPTFSREERHHSPLLFTSVPVPDAPVDIPVLPTNQPAPILHYVANTSVVHSAAMINNEIRTTEIFTNTEIKEEKEVSKVFLHETTTNDPAFTGDKCITKQDDGKNPPASNENIQTKSSPVDIPVAHQQEQPATFILKDKLETKFQVKSPEDKQTTIKVSLLQKQPSRFPDLEPFPFQPSKPKNRPTPCPPPPKPSKFIKGEFMESDYESEFESHIPPKWRPYESDTEEPTYRRVRPPSFTHPKRPKSTEPSPLPPSSFEKPLKSDGILRPIIDKTLSDVKEIKSTSSKKTVSAFQSKSYAQSKTDKIKKQQTNETFERDSSLVLKPGSPPEFVQPVVLPKAQEPHQIIKTERLSPTKTKIDSPKSKTKSPKGEFPESGYMADTDEPRQFKYAHHKSTIKHEESLKTTVEKTTLITEKTLQQSSQTQARAHKPHSEVQSSSSQLHPVSRQQTQQHGHHQVHKTQQKTSSSEKTSPSKLQSAKFHHKHLETKYEQKAISSTGSTKSKKEVISTITPEVQKEVSKEKREMASIPTKPDPPGPPVKQHVRQSLPSPSKFLKGEFRESDYESDYESRILPKWKPADSDADEPKYKPVHPVLSQKGYSQSPMFDTLSPTPPTEFDNPPEFSGPPRPKFEPIEKPSQSVKMDVTHKSSMHHQKVFKPKPVTPRTVPPILDASDVKAKESQILKPGPCPEMGYIPPPPRTKISIAPFEKATQIETSKVVNIAESTEHMHRVVNVQQTTHVIKFGEKEKEIFDSKPQNFPFKTDPEKHRCKRPLLTAPKKFVPGDFYESEYESDLESVKIKPKWTPGNSDTEEPHYRKVRPPQLTRSPIGPPVTPERSYSSHPQPVFTESSLAATTNIAQNISVQKSEFQKNQVCNFDKMRNNETCKKEQQWEFQPTGKEIIRQQDIQLQPGEPPKFCYAGDVSSVASYVSSKHMNDMTNTFRSRAQQFASDIMSDVSNSRQNEQPEKVISKQVDSHDIGPENADDPQAYREESRVAEYGTKHIDPDTGLIYFKYDFGYEFGIVLPNEGKKQEGSRPKYPKIERKQSGDIEVPVIHEKKATENEKNKKATETRINPGPTQVPQFKPKKFTHFKSVKWEPASESEMSEVEGDSVKLKKTSSFPQSSSAIQKEPHIQIPSTSQWASTPPSPLSLSLSPSIPSLSPCTGATLDSTASPGGSWQGLSPSKSPRVGYGRGNTPTPPGTPSTAASLSGPASQHLCKPPAFITALRDITVMKGQPLCFECIVQAEPPPNILWAKDGRLLENSVKHQIHFKNGVCRLTLSQTSPGDSGNYTCTATNKLGTVKTSGLLQVSGEKRFLHK